ncbi:MAG TPA: PIN domain-containing protein [Bacteroidetes bacterium]|nr:PIN domain-containing protein [Bacteroidota bacterium]
MVLLLDTNIWIKGLRQSNNACQIILSHLGLFDVLFPAQVRQELSNNLSALETSLLYNLIHAAAGFLDFEPPPKQLVDHYYDKGLRKGDMIIAAFCEWRNVDVVVSTNRDFLRGISGEVPFKIMSPEHFCLQAKLL